MNLPISLLIIASIFASTGQVVARILGDIKIDREPTKFYGTLTISNIRSEDGNPVVITRHGKKQAVVLSYEEWQRLSQVPSFGRLLMAVPAKAGDLPARNRAKPRTTNF